MATASFSFLEPWALLLCVAALVPIGVLAALTSRQRHVLRRLGLVPAQGRSVVALAAFTGGACLAFAIAAAQPILMSTTTRTVRTQSEAVVVIDVSRSMLASRAPDRPTRLERARSIAASIRGSAPDVPTGLAGLTDRVLPYLFPTDDETTFAATLERSVLPEAPPPEQVAPVATTFAPLPALVRDGFFSRRARYRTCVVLTDGETRAAAAETSGAGRASLPALGGGSSSGGEEALGDAHALAGTNGCRLVVVRVGDSSERIFRPNGAVEAQYRPEASAAATVEALARAAGGTAFSEDEVGAAEAAVREATERGELRRIGVRPSVRELAPYAAGLGALLALLVVGGEGNRLRRLALAQGD